MTQGQAIIFDRETLLMSTKLQLSQGPKPLMDLSVKLEFISMEWVLSTKASLAWKTKCEG